MTRWWLVIGLLLSLGVNVGVFATLALGGRRLERAVPPTSQPLHRQPNFTALADRLALEGEARQQFLRIQERFVDAVRSHRSRLVQIRRQLYQEMVAQEPNPRRIEHLLTQQAEAQIALERALVQNVLESRRFLTAEDERLYLRFLATRLRSLQREPGAPPPRRRPKPPAGRTPADGPLG